MRRELMKILTCPVCRFHPLKMTASKVVKNEVVAGVIVCPKCKRRYPIKDGIPELLPDLKGWYKGAGSPKAYDVHFDKWTKKSQYQAKHPWPFKVVIARKAKGLVLDAGCGYGCIARFIKRGVFLDFSPVALKKRWVGGNRPRVLASAENMPFINGVFDTVIATELIEHTDDPNRLVKEVYRVLKKNGQFLFSFPWSDVSPTHHFKIISKDMVHKWISPPFKRFKYDIPPVRKERGMVYAYK